jgi:transcriptional regulator with XRE-family HTH domain
MATLGERVRELRERARLTQDELAARAKLSKGFLSDIENNKRTKVGSDFLLRIATTLGTTVEFLMTGEEDEDAAAAAPIVIPTELNAYADQAHLSYKETMELLAAHRSVVAKRSNVTLKPLTVDDWKDLHATLKKLYG